jgi:hypothetical protein
LVANDEVLYSSGAAAKEFALGFARLMTIKVQEAKLAVDLRFLSEEIEPLNRDNTLINDQFEALSAQGKLDQQFLDVYQKRFKRNGERLDLLLPEQTQKLDQKSALVLRMNKQAIEEIASLSGHVAKTVIAIRKDLELPPNASVILDHYQGTIDEMAKMMPKFIDDVWSDLDLQTEGEQRW